MCFNAILSSWQAAPAQRIFAFWNIQSSRILFHLMMHCIFYRNYCYTNGVFIILNRQFNYESSIQRKKTNERRRKKRNGNGNGNIVIEMKKQRQAAKFLFRSIYCKFSRASYLFNGNYLIYRLLTTTKCRAIYASVYIRYKTRTHTHAHAHTRTHDIKIRDN